MKKITCFIQYSMVLLLLFSLYRCSENVDIQENTTIIKTITAENEDISTRVAIDEQGSVCWEEGDIVYLCEVNASGYTGQNTAFTLSQGQGTKSGTFTSEEGIVSGKKYIAIHSKVVDNIILPVKGEELAFNISPVQLYRKGDIGKYIAYYSKPITANNSTINAFSLATPMSLVEFNIGASSSVKNFALQSVSLTTSGTFVFGKTLKVNMNGELVSNSIQTTTKMQVALDSSQNISPQKSAKCFIAILGAKKPNASDQINIQVSSAREEYFSMQKEAINFMAKTIYISNVNVNNLNQRKAWDGKSIEEIQSDGSNKYLIDNEAQLAWMAQMSNAAPAWTSGKQFFLTRNMLLNNHPWIPIENFLGKFDGNGFSINGLCPPDNFTYQEYGFFRVNNGEIKNLNLSGTTGIPFNNMLMGSLVYNNLGKITNCNNSANILNTSYNRLNYGGIAYLNNGEIKACNSSGAISINRTSEVKHDGVYKGLYIGGICAVNKGTIRNCNRNGSTNISTIISHGGITTDGTLASQIGGITAYNEGNISDCQVSQKMDINYRHISNHSPDKISLYVGGIAGYSKGSIAKCINDQPILVECVHNHIQPYCYGDSYAYTGGIVGYMNEKTSLVENCINNGSINSRSKSSALGTVYAYAYAGGVAGYCMGLISAGENNGSINAHSIGGANGETRLEGYAGGICGRASSSKIIGCKNSGIVSRMEIENKAALYLGGLIGYNQGNIISSINCGSVSELYNYTNCGGIAGYNYSANNIVNSYYDKALISSNGTKYGVALSQELMNSKEIVDQLNSTMTEIPYKWTTSTQYPTIQK